MPQKTLAAPPLSLTPQFLPPHAWATTFESQVRGKSFPGKEGVFVCLFFLDGKSNFLVKCPHDIIVLNVAPDFLKPSLEKPVLENSPGSFISGIGFTQFLHFNFKKVFGPSNKVTKALKITNLKEG